MWRISSSKPKLHSNKSSLIHYLVCVPEFTDLSGNQVSLVILHLHGIDILLTQSEERKETNTLSTPKKILILQQPEPCSSPFSSPCASCKDYLLFLLFPLLDARLTVRILWGSIKLTCILSDEDIYCPLHSLVSTQGFFIKNLLFVFIPVFPAATDSLLIRSRKIWRQER